MNRLENNNKGQRGMSIILMITIPNPDPREPSPDFAKQREGSSYNGKDNSLTATDQDNGDPNTDLTGIKDDRTHDTEEEQSKQKEKDDEDEPDLSGEINV